jgi:precorrin-8X/cobalt-precorrin-8 methylmutase
MMDYIRDPEAIYARSFEMIRAEAIFTHMPSNAESVAVRIIHACGMVDAAHDLNITDDFVPSALAAIRSGAPVIVDAEMVRHGVIPRLTKDTKIVCTLNDPVARAKGVAAGITRSAAAVQLWTDQLSNSVVAIGNAPTALFALLELIAAGGPKPAAIAAFPVGFVGAAESKEALIASGCGVPYATLRGRRGGSAMAAAAINALLEMRG